MIFMKKNILGPLLALLTLLVVMGCEKDPEKISPPPRPDDDGGPSAAHVLDSVYSTYKRLSYWESAVEVYDPISDLTDDYSDAHRLLSYLKSQTPKKTDYVFHPEYSGPLDRFSWVE